MSLKSGGGTSPVSTPAGTRSVKRYGWIADLPDHRDYLYAAPFQEIGNLPTTCDLRPGCPPVYDQGQLGSCTANAIAGAIAFEQIKQSVPEDQQFTPSRLFIYYNERAIEGRVNEDSGAQIRDGMKTVSSKGICPEDGPPTGAGPDAVWPYDITEFTQKPPAPCYTFAADHLITQYQRVLQDLGQMKGCLASGYPFVLGFTVYEGFEGPAVAKTGRVDLPAPGERVVGGHAVMAVGYEDSEQRFTIRNSWSQSWGDGGYFTLPYAYLINSGLASDFWTIRMVQAAVR